MDWYLVAWWLNEIAQPIAIIWAVVIFVFTRKRGKE